MKYKILYDLAAEKINYFKGPLVFSYIFLIIGICIIYSLFKNGQYKELSNGNINATRKLVIGGVFLALPIFLMFIFLGSQIADRIKANHIIEEKTFMIVEGKTENYHAMPKWGHDTERFDINDVHFEYGDYIIKFGYSNAASLGGVIQPDNYYRITYYSEPYNNAIIKIEVEE